MKTHVQSFLPEMALIPFSACFGWSAIAGVVAILPLLSSYFETPATFSKTPFNTLLHSRMQKLHSK